MMTGLVVRMAQSLGLHRDGAHFDHLTSYEVEMRRRVWWALCVLDVRSSEDQGMDMAIAYGSFDTKLPLNINDADIESGSKTVPTEREGLTDMSISLVSLRTCEISRRLMALATKDNTPSLDEQEHLLNEIYEKFDQGYLRYTTESGNIIYWVGVCVARLVMAKMRLIIYLPVLFSSPTDHFSDEIREKLFIAAIEVAEYNHALNAEQAARCWRWAYQTYTHWHAIVYLLIEISRRSWSPIVERAWVALHSAWLIPAQSSTDKNQRVWIPLRKLMAKAGKHRAAELKRLQRDPQAAKRLEKEDNNMALPLSPGPFPRGADSVELFRQRWRQLVAIPEQFGNGKQTSAHQGKGASVDPNYTPQSAMDSTSAYASTTGSSSNGTFLLPYISSSEPLSVDSNPLITSTEPLRSDIAFGNNIEQQQQLYDNFSANPMPNWSGEQTAAPSHSIAWLWADTDPSVDVFANVDMDSLDVNMDLDGGEVNWYNWVEFAKGMEWDAGPGGSGQM